mgnify:CR=1 FL=1
MCPGVFRQQILTNQTHLESHTSNTPHAAHNPRPRLSPVQPVNRKRIPRRLILRSVANPASQISGPDETKG